jgi:hypothetical protein
MAGLAPFTNSNLHQLMTGKSMLVAANAKAPPLQKSRGDMVCPFSWSILLMSLTLVTF